MPGPEQQESGRTLAEGLTCLNTHLGIWTFCPSTAFLSWAPDSSYPWVPPRVSPPQYAQDLRPAALL